MSDVEPQEKRLGNIERIRLGHCGTTNNELGLYLYLQGPGWRASTHYSFWDAVKVPDGSELNPSWPESVRDVGYAAVMRKISELLAQARVISVDQLKGIPVEATLIKKTGKLVDWRVLTEVIPIKK